jgi:hypothetical protein
MNDTARIGKDVEIGGACSMKRSEVQILALHLKDMETCFKACLVEQGKVQ